MQKGLIIFFYLLLGCFPVKTAVSQVLHFNSRIITGKLIDNETGKGIPFVHVLNESLRVSTISDTSGRYTIRGNTGDTLVFSVLGYLGKYIVFKGMKAGELPVTELVPRTYDIAEVRVFGYSSYSKFKQDFQNLRLPETQTDRLREDLNQIALEIGKEARYQLEMEKAARGGNLLSVPILSPEEVQRLKLKEIIKEEKIQSVIDKKFNREIVAGLTGLHDKELDDFMLFCNLDRQFLLEANQYEILVKVLERFEAFKQIKKNTGTIQKPFRHACSTFLS
ncbi:MAG: carboxypeptidase-like regulatory domain-containing protein [Bacteroidales bacterium]|nr:carboxypeptidase-like regulatory domain-containing protein [Bacteroidales bacterium]